MKEKNAIVKDEDEFKTKGKTKRQRRKPTMRSYQSLGNSFFTLEQEALLRSFLSMQQHGLENNKLLMQMLNPTVQCLITPEAPSSSPGSTIQR